MCVCVRVFVLTPALHSGAMCLVVSWADVFQLFPGIGILGSVILKVNKMGVYRHNVVRRKKMVVILTPPTLLSVYQTQLFTLC